jgi:hypothetical protein
MRLPQLARRSIDQPVAILHQVTGTHFQVQSESDETSTFYSRTNTIRYDLNHSLLARRSGHPSVVPQPHHPAGWHRH